MELLLRPWKMYADSTGRARRSEYWLFFGIKYLVILFPFVLFDMAGRSGRGDGLLGSLPVILIVVWGFATLIPSVTLLARRLHDFDASGKWCLTTFIPYVGFIAVIVIGLVPPTRGENEKGYDPREENLGHVEAVFD